MPRYVELAVASNFSFLRGASHPEELVERAAALGYKALALTDECSFAGAVRAHQAAKEHGLKLILGTEVVLEKTKLVLLATDRKAYGAISSLITLGRRRSKKGKYSLSRGDVEGLAGSGTLVLWVPGEDPEADADLRCGEAGAGRGEHGVGQVGDELAQLLVEAVDLRRALTQHGVAEQADGLDGHGSPRSGTGGRAKSREAPVRW